MPKPAAPRTVTEYLAGIDEPRRSDMTALHDMITRALPHLAPSIQYGMIGYGTYHYRYASGREGDAPVIALSSRKQYISVYVPCAEGAALAAENRKAELPKADLGKGCIRFKRLADIDLEALEKIVRLGARARA